MAAAERWLDVAKELDLVARASVVGKKMFSCAHELAVAEKVTAVMSMFSEELSCVTS